MANSVSTEKMKTKKVRVFYAYLLEPKMSDSKDEDRGTYQCLLAIPKSDKSVIKKIKELSEGLAKQCFGKTWTKCALPLKDGEDFTDREGDHDDWWDDYMYLNAKSRYKPDIIDVYHNKLDSEEDVYSGMDCLACINFYSYEYEGKKGISCGLSSMVKIGAGERVVGTASADSDFAGVDLGKYAEEMDEFEEEE